MVATAIVAVVVFLSTVTEGFLFSNFVRRFASPAIRTTTTTTATTPFSTTTSLRMNLGEPLLTDETLEEWLDDMIYSGDIEGFIRRRSKDVVSLDFKEYLDERLAACNDEDEMRVLTEISKILTNKLMVSDGLVDSDEVFLTRLDKILFTSPNQRKAVIMESLDDMTPGFVEYIQREMKSTADADNKVVYASILQLIGQSKGADLLGGDAVILTGADGSLGDQFKKAESSVLAGGDMSLDEAKKTKVGDRNEVILAGLMFSTNDILEDVLNNLHEIDDGFVEFLQKKVDTSKDMDERVGLSSLLQTITTVLDRVKEAQGDGTIDAQQEELTIDQVKQRMQEVQAGQALAEQADGKVADRFGVFQVKEEKKDTFKTILKRFTDLPEGMTLEEAVDKNYDLCDYEFMGMLKSEVDACHAEGADIEAQQYEAIQAMVNQVMVKRIGGAQDRLQHILSKRSPPAMESEVVAMVRRGEVDEALLLLIEANTQQAEMAGATQAADVLRKLSRRIIEEQERKLPDEQRLLRALVRIEDSEKRKSLLYESFKPQKSMGTEGGFVEGPPLIAPPAFINCVRTFITNFGNVDSFNLLGRAQAIIDDAQAVATELYGEGMSPRQQQKYMFEKGTMSVWDLADYEDMSVMSGEEVPWRNDAWDTKSPEEVVGERVRRIGGGDGSDAPM